MILPALMVAGSLAGQLHPSAGLVARIGSAEFRHPTHASVLGVSADGKRVYTAQPAPLNHERADLFVWEVATGRLVARHPLGLPGDRIMQIGFGPDGVRIFARVGDGANNQLRIVDPDTGKTVRTGKAWKDPPREQSNDLSRGWYNFSHDAAWMVRPGKNGFDLYNAATGDVTVIDLGRASVAYDREFGFAPDGNHVFSIREGTTQLFELPAGKRVAEFAAGPGRAQHAAGFTPDGKQLLLWSAAGGAWSLDAYDIAEKRRRTVLRGRTLPGRIHFAPDGKTFALVPCGIGSYHPAGDWEVRDFATGKELGRVPVAGYIGDVQFSPDGRTLLTQPGGHTVVPWDVATGRPAAGAPNPLGPVDRFAFDADGNLVGLAGGFVSTWNPLTGKELARRRVPRMIDGYGAVAFNPAADRLHFTGLGDKLVAWDFRAGKVQESPLPLKRLPNSAVEQRFTPDGTRHVEYTYPDGALIFRDPATGQETARLPVPDVWRPRNHPEAVYGLATSADGRRVAIGGDILRSDQEEERSLVAVLDADGSGKPIVLNTTGRVDSLAFSPDGRWCVVGTQRLNPTSGFGVWDAATGRRVATVNLGVPGWVNALRFSPDGRLLAVSLGRHEVRLVETATWRVRATVFVPGWESPHYFGTDRNRDVIAWSPDGRHLAVGTTDGGLLVWDVRRLGGVEELAAFAPLARGWPALRGDDAAAAFVTIKSFAANPERSIPLLKSTIVPVAAPDPARVQALLAALGGDEFREREQATADLAKLGRLAEPALRERLRTTDSPEVAQRIGGLLQKLGTGKPTAAEVLAVRAVEIAELAATPEAVRLLEGWAGGAAGARLTAEAKAALARLKR